jgi:hypothetical protein
MRSKLNELFVWSTCTVIWIFSIVFVLSATHGKSTTYWWLNPPLDKIDFLELLIIIIAGMYYVGWTISAVLKLHEGRKDKLDAPNGPQRVQVAPGTTNDVPVCPKCGYHHPAAPRIEKD